MDQEAKEKTARIIKTGLSVLGASQTCISQLVPFMCLYLFPLCGTNATAVSREQCIQISTDVCKEQWQLALGIPTVKDYIPNCGSLPSKRGLSFGSINVNLFLYLYHLFLSEIDLPLIRVNTSMTNITSASVLVNCSDGFLLINGTCTPLCDKLILNSPELSLARFWIQVASSIIGIVFSVLLVISSYVKRKTM